MFKKIEPTEDDELVEAMINDGERPYCLSHYKDEILKAQQTAKQLAQPIQPKQESRFLYI